MCRFFVLSLRLYFEAYHRFGISSMTQCCCSSHTTSLQTKIFTVSILCCTDDIHGKIQTFFVFNYGNDVWLNRKPFRLNEVTDIFNYWCFLNVSTVHCGAVTIQMAVF